MEKSFHIGRLVELTGRSEHTIRWYERQGLIPNVGRDRGGRRVYEQGHVDHLIFLEWLRLTGMTVADMRTFTDLSMQGWRTLEKRQELLNTHRQTVEQRIVDLQVALDLIEAKTEYFSRWASQKKRPTPPPLPDFADRHSRSRVCGPRNEQAAE